MIAPAPLATLLAGTRIQATRDAIVASLGRLLPGVTVTGHPGKLDINDVVAKAIVRAPGIAVGYTRVRQLGELAGSFTVGIDFAAYIVVEDWVDTTSSPPRAMGREVVAHAIGLQLLRILRDPDAGSWGLGGIEPPAMDPPPAFAPVFTMKVADQATALYAVTWSQGLVHEGQPFFNYGPTPAVAGIGSPEGDADGLPADGAEDDAVVFDLPEGDENDYPPELLAHIRRGGPVFP